MSSWKHTTPTFWLESWWLTHWDRLYAQLIKGGGVGVGRGSEGLLNFPLLWRKLTALTIWLKSWWSTRPEVLCICSVQERGGNRLTKIFNILCEAYAAVTMDGYIVVDSLLVCFLVVFRGVCWTFHYVTRRLRRPHYDRGHIILTDTLVVSPQF